MSSMNIFYVEIVRKDRLNESGWYEVEFDWRCDCGEMNTDAAARQHLIAAVDVQCKKCGRTGLAEMPMLFEESPGTDFPERAVC